jgi:folylpolyglutamate synthase/dihydropteroate synthase
MTLDDWLAYISAQHPSTIALGLDRVREVADRMCVTPAKAGAQSVTFTIGGTNGKGSTCAYLERILLESGYRVGLYTSPHLLAYNEAPHPSRTSSSARSRPSPSSRTRSSTRWCSRWAWAGGWTR